MLIDSLHFLLLPFPMFRQRYTLFCPDPRSTLVPVHSSPNLCARRLPRPRRDGGVYPERLGAFSFPLAMPIAEPPSVSHPTHSEANASLLCSIAPARHVGLGHAPNRLDFSRCSLCEQKRSNSRANNALIFNNLQTHEPLTPLNSCTYKIGGGYFPERINFPRAATHRWDPPFGTRSMLLRPFDFHLSTACPERSRRVNSSSTIPALHSGAHFTSGER
jgi:hypothetical protein